MFSKFQHSIPETSIDLMITNYIRKPWIQDWIAELQASLQSTISIDNMPLLTSDEEGATDGDYTFEIQFQKDISLFHIRQLLLLSWWFPNDLKSLIILGVESFMSTKGLSDHQDSIFMSSKSMTLIWLASKNISDCSLFGDLQKALKELECRRSKYPENLIQSIFRPFWRPNSPKVKRYTGYTKHYKDAGSLRPVSSFKVPIEYKYNPQEYIKFLEMEQEKISSTYEFLLGFLS